MIPVCHKVLTIIIKEKLEPYIENGLGEYQSGFRKGRSTIDHIFTIRNIMEKCWQYNKDIWQIFVYFKQAYDSINRASLWNIMAEFSIPSKLIKLVKACYSNSNACVQVGQRRTTEFEIKSCLRQGCLLSPILFNMILENVKTSIDEIQGGVDIGGVNIQTLAYADFGIQTYSMYLAGPDRADTALILSLATSSRAFSELDNCCVSPWAINFLLLACISLLRLNVGNHARLYSQVNVG